MSISDCLGAQESRHRLEGYSLRLQVLLSFCWSQDNAVAIAELKCVCVCLRVNMSPIILIKSYKYEYATRIASQSIPGSEIQRAPSSQHCDHQIQLLASCLDDKESHIIHTNGVRTKAYILAWEEFETSGASITSGNMRGLSPVQLYWKQDGIPSMLSASGPTALVRPYGT